MGLTGLESTVLMPGINCLGPGIKCRRQALSPAALVKGIVHFDAIFAQNGGEGLGNIEAYL